MVRGLLKPKAYSPKPMSGINGDKSRHAIARKRGIARRAKIKALVAAKKNPSSATPAAAPEKSPRSSAKAR
jgi:hypothetical protein